MWKRLRAQAPALAWAVALVWFPLGVAGAGDDAFIAGYATGMLEQEFRLNDATVTVTDGVLFLRARDLGGLRPDQLRTALGRIPGVARVEIEMVSESSVTVPAGTGPAAGASVGEPPSRWFPHGLLFDPLHADPRWPHFSVTYRRFLDNTQFKNGAAANVGGTVSVYRGAPSARGQWEIGFQAGLFSLFDLSSSSGSNDLINNDYTLALFYAYRRGQWSTLLRLNHQSSHIGDEFLENSGTKRVEVNYDRIDLKLSYDAWNWLRIYGGGGILLRQSPDGLGNGTVQFGAELTSPSTYWHGRLRPVAYADVQLFGRTDWSVGNSVMAGVQFENLRLDGRAIQLLIEYYGGPFPDGQFFTQKTQWLGVGLHFYF
jgi:hypothetical protein